MNPLPILAATVVAPLLSLSAQTPVSKAFDQAGARLAIDATDGDPAPISMTFRLDRWGRTGATRGTPHRPAQPGDAGTFCYRHEDIVEIYRETSAGIDQSFVIDNPPPGNGDLILSITANGDGVAQPSDAHHGALTFRWPDGTEMQYGAAFAFGRGESLTPIATRFDGDSHIELIVPEALVEGANYPLTIDPAIGFTTVIGVNTYNDSHPDCAQAITGNRFFNVWQRNIGGVKTVHGQVRYRSGDANSPVSGVLTIAPNGENPTVCYTENLGQPGWCVAWERNDRIEYRLYGLDGTNLTGVFSASSPASGERHRRPSISGMEASGILIAWDHTEAGANNPSEIQVRQLWPSPGQPNGGGPVRTLQTVTVNGYVQRVRLPRNHVTVDTAGATWLASRATWERWYDQPAPGDFDIESAAFRMTPFSPAGTFVLTDGPGLIAFTIGVSEKLPDIGLMASTGDDPNDASFLVAYEREPGDVVARLFDFDSATSTLLTVRATSDYEGAPAVGVGSCEWFVGYSEIDGPNEFDIDMCAAWLRPDGTVVDAHSPIQNGNGVFQSNMRASSRPIGTGNEPERNGIQFIFQSETGPPTGLNSVRVRFFEPVNVSYNNVVSGCPASNGSVPNLTLLGLPYAGNADWRMILQGTPSNAITMLMIGTDSISVPIPGAPGCVLYPQLPLLAADLQVSTSSGSSQFAVPIPCHVPPFASLYFQGAVYDPAANALGWVTSNGRRITWGL